MSTVKVTNLQNASSTSANITLDTAGNATVANTLAMGSSFLRNRIINGDMRIDQRNNGASVGTGSGILAYNVDRWYHAYAQTSKFTIQQSSTAPTGHTKSLLVTSSSAYSVLTGDSFFISQGIEGLNVADLGWGAAGAQSVTLSFWVRSSLTGSFGGAIINSGANRSYPFGYTISSANTWEQKTVTIPGDASGTWLTNTSVGITVRFGIGAGSTFTGTVNTWAASNLVQPTGTVSVVGTNAATWYLTGVQFEAGSVATPFERRLYGQELALCQRYYYRTVDNALAGLLWSGGVESATSANVGSVHPVPMRATPTVSFGSGLRFFSPASSVVTPTITTQRSSLSNGGLLLGISGGTAGQAGWLYNAGGGSSYIECSVEL